MRTLRKSAHAYAVVIILQRGINLQKILCSLGFGETWFVWNGGCLMKFCVSGNFFEWQIARMILSRKSSPECHGNVNKKCK